MFDDLVQYVKSEVLKIEIPELPRIGENKDELESNEEQGETSENQGSLKRKAEETSIDLFKYDVKKVDKTGFGGEEFIKFSDQRATTLVEIDEGEDMNPHISFGIAAPLSFPTDNAVKEAISEHKKTGKKRKCDKAKVNVGSGYKEICVKQLNSNPNKKKKNKLKMKKTK